MGPDWLAGVPIIGDLINYASNERTNDANAENAEANRQFQERMSNTAYQRSTTDMMSAGLNPMLAYQQGSASSPQGSMSVSHPYTGGLSSAMAALKNKAEVDLLNAQTKNVVAQTPGVSATSSRLERELKELVPVQIRSAQLDQDVKDVAAYFGQREKNYAMVNTVERQRQVERYLAAKLDMLPVELRTKMADLVVKQFMAKAARGADEGYESMKRGARYVGDALGKVTNSAVDAYRGAKHGYERFKANAQYRRKYEFDR